MERQLGVAVPAAVCYWFYKAGKRIARREGYGAGRSRGGGRS
jgi:hypothetical protein